MDAHSIFLPASGYRRERWRNGAGWTREIARDVDGADWNWRLSIAEIDAPAAFSTFDGIEREQLLLAGNGLRLHFDGGAMATLMPPHGRHRYRGEDGVRGEPVDGPVRAFNLMWRRDRVGAGLWYRPLVGPMVVFVEPRVTWAVHLAAGHAQFTDGSGLPRLAAGDTAILAAGEERLRYVLDGGGEALLVRLAPPGSQ